MLRRGHLARVQFQRVDLLGLRARAALARAAHSAGYARRRWLGKVDSDILRLRRERIPAALALADMVEGGRHHLAADDARSGPCLARASRAFDALAMHLHARVSELARGHVLGDPELSANAERGLEQLGVRNASGMLRLWIPGVVAAPGPTARPKAQAPGAART
jgi:hypothetical protein